MSNRSMAIYQKIIQFLKNRLKNDKIKVATLQSLPFWIASLVTGLVAVFYSQLFHWIELLHAEITFERNYWIFLFIPIAFFLSWWLVKKYSPESSGSGIPQLSAAIEMSGKKGQNKAVNVLLSFRVIFIKIASSVVMLLGGGAIGREGPTIQISGSIFNVVNKFVPKDWPKISKRLMLISGGAAGLAAAFNTPLGGIVFAIEEIGKTHLNAIRTHLFVAVIIAGLTAQVLLGSYLYVGTPILPPISFMAIIYVVITAICAGYLGYIFSRFILIIVRVKRKIKSRKKVVIWVITCGLLFATLVFYTGNETVGSGKPLLTDLLFNADRNVSWHAFPSRFFGSILSYAAGGAGGIFAPSLSIGAALGDTISNFLDIAEFKNIIIIAGMIGFMTGVTHSPFTSFILVLEMTDRHTSVFPMMLAALVAYIVSRSFNRSSLYEQLAKMYIVKPPA